MQNFSTLQLPDVAKSPFEFGAYCVSRTGINILKYFVGGVYDSVLLSR